jgi:para-nitrobenzyl esterase
LAKGLFHRAIGESGGLFAPMKDLAEAEKAGESLASSLHATENSLKALRALSAEELLNAGDTPIASAIVDGWVLPADVQTIFSQGKQNDVPLLVGSNADEGTTLAPQGAKVTSEVFIGQIRQRYGSQAEQFLKVYPAASDSEAVASFYAAYRDQVFGWEMRTWARMAAQTGRHSVYLYYFSHRPPGPQSSRLGAFHACELPYIFGNFIWPFPWEEEDRKLSDAVSTYWVNFARTGDPNGDGLVKWPAWSPASEQALEFGDHINIHSQVNKPGLDFFDSYYHSLSALKGSTTSGERGMKK